jgi:CheY-like chemotaxis protein
MPSLSKKNVREVVRVLLAEDTPTWQNKLRADIEHALRGVNLVGEVRTVSECREAIEALEIVPHWDLLVVDLHLQDAEAENHLNGMELIQRALYKGFKEIIAVTVRDKEIVTREVVRKLMGKLKVRDVIFKTEYDLDQFIDVVQQAVESARLSMRNQVFISYSHKDQKWLTKLQTCLAPLARKNVITVWDDTKIKAGTRWRDAIKKELAAAKVAVLLVTPNFLASEFIVEHELPPLLEAAEKDGLKIIWVAVSDSLYMVTEIENYQAANNPARPLDKLGPEALRQEIVNICREIKEAATDD